MAEWTTTERELVTGRGRYIIARVAGAWEAQFRARVQPYEDEKRVAIYALDAEGECVDWDTPEMAQLACQDHHERMVRFGESANLAAVQIAAATDVLSQEVRRAS